MESDFLWKTGKTTPMTGNGWNLCYGGLFIRIFGKDRERIDSKNLKSIKEIQFRFRKKPK